MLRANPYLRRDQCQEIGNLIPNERQGEATSTTSTTLSASETQFQEASNTIFSALRDHELRVLRNKIGIPKQMMEKLDARYDSKKIASRASEISELVSIREYIDKHIDELAGIIEQLHSMGSTLDDALDIGISFISITFPN